MSEITRLVTADELEKLAGEDCRYELVAGRLIRMSPVGYQHGKIVLRFAALLDRYLEGRDLLEFEDIVPGFRCRVRGIVGG